MQTGPHRILKQVVVSVLDFVTSLKRIHLYDKSLGVARSQRNAIVLAVIWYMMSLHTEEIIIVKKFRNHYFNKTQVLTSRKKQGSSREGRRRGCDACNTNLWFFTQFILNKPAPLLILEHTCDLWDICSEWWENITWPTKKTKTFREHLQRAIFEICDLWDIWSV